jgi:hypothetical protein
MSREPNDMYWNRNSSLCAATVAFLAIAAINPGTLRAQAQAPAAPTPTVTLPLQVGFFNGATALYITPEVGVDPNAPAAIIAAAKQVATGFNSNFIPQNFQILPGSTAVDDIFVFTNFTQGNVLASAPHPAGPTNTDTSYSPLWQVSLVTWNPGSQGRVLTSQTDITNAASAGEVTIQQTPIIVECSVIFTPSGGLLPGARATGQGFANNPTVVTNPPANATEQLFFNDFAVSAARSTDPNGLPLAFQWAATPRVNFLPSSTTPNPVIQFPASGTYTITVTVADTSGGSATASFTLMYLRN